MFKDWIIMFLFDSAFGMAPIFVSFACGEFFDNIVVNSYVGVLQVVEQV